MPPHRQPAGQLLEGRPPAELPGEQGCVRRTGGRARTRRRRRDSGGTARQESQDATRRPGTPPRPHHTANPHAHHPSGAARSRTGPGGGAAVGHGGRELAPAPVDAARPPRTPLGPYAPGRVRGDGRRCCPAGGGGPGAGRGRCGHRWRAAPRQLLKLRRRAAAELPADPHHRPAALRRRPRGVRTGTAVPRRAGRRDPPPGGVRAAGAGPAAGRPRGRLRRAASPTDRSRSPSPGPTS